MMSKTARFASGAVRRLMMAGVLAAISLCGWSVLDSQERPWSVTSCELLKNPRMYDESMVSVPGLVLYGAGEFSIHGFDCADEYGPLRVEFGGNPADPSDRFRLSQSRLETGSVPLKVDRDYETTQKLMRSIDDEGRTRMLRATLKGRFFAGQPVGSKSGEVTHPHAHLAVSEVELVSERVEDAVDFTPVSHFAAKTAKGCNTTVLEVPSRQTADDLQRRSREESENLQYLNDPAQVAARAIAEQEKVDGSELVGKLKVVSQQLALNEYSWSSADGLRTYEITVNRPYWLLPSTYSANTLIWVPKRLVRTTCSAKSSR